MDSTLLFLFVYLPKFCKTYSDANGRSSVSTQSAEFSCWDTVLCGEFSNPSKHMIFLKSRNLKIINELWWLCTDWIHIQKRKEFSGSSLKWVPWMPEHTLRWAPDLIMMKKRNASRLNSCLKVNHLSKMNNM